MNRISRNALAGALALGVGLGVTAPAAMAAPPAAHSSGHDKAAHSAKAEQVKADRKLANAQRKLSREAKRKDAFLGRVLERNALARLDDAVEAPLRTNIEADRTALGTLATSVAAAAGVEELAALAGDLREIRPERYNTIISMLRQATRLQAEAAAGEIPVVDPPVTDPVVDPTVPVTDPVVDPVVDPTVPVTPDVTAALDALVAQLVTFTASTPRADLRLAKRELSAIAELLDPEEDLDDVEEPVVTP